MKLVIPGHFPSPSFDQLQYAESKRGLGKRHIDITGGFDIS